MYERTEFKKCPKCKIGMLTHTNTQTKCNCGFVMIDGHCYDENGDKIEIHEN